MAAVEGFEALAELKALTEVTMDFGDSEIADTKALGVGLGGMERLQKLSLYFGRCSSLAAVEGFEPLFALGQLKQCDILPACLKPGFLFGAPEPCDVPLPFDH